MVSLRAPPAKAEEEEVEAVKWDFIAENVGIEALVAVVAEVSLIAEALLSGAFFAFFTVENP